MGHSYCKAKKYIVLKAYVREDEKSNINKSKFLPQETKKIRKRKGKKYQHKMKEVNNTYKSRNQEIKNRKKTLKIMK